MQYNRLYKKIWPLLFSVLLVLAVSAQEHGFRFFPVKGLSVYSHALLGNSGSHFFFLNTEMNNGISLQIADTITQNTVTRKYPFPKQIVSIQIKENALVFVGLMYSQGTPYCEVLAVDTGGTQLYKKEIPLPFLHGPLKATASEGKQYMLLYEMAGKAADSTQMRGALLGADWEIKKQLRYSFAYNTELDAGPEVFADNMGNTHVIVYDKYSNFRISGDVTVNTIPLTEEQIVSETFTFQKVKLKTLHVFQNTECNCIQIEGIYADGVSKNNKGVYSIAFPPGRKNELAPRFIPFSNEMIKYFRKDFSATDETILKSIQLQDIAYSDAGSFLILRISNGIPQKPLRMNPEDNPSTRSLSQSLGVSRGADYQPPPTQTLVSGTAGSAVLRTRNVPVAPIDKGGSATQMLAGAPPKSSPLSSRSTGRNAPKFICIKLDKEQGIHWYTGISLDVFNADDEWYNRVFFVKGEKSELPLMLYQADALDEPFPMVVTMKDGQQWPDKFPQKKIIFTPMLLLNHFQYGSIYRNTENGESGLMVVQTLNE